MTKHKAILGFISIVLVVGLACSGLVSAGPYVGRPVLSPGTVTNGNAKHQGSTSTTSNDDASDSTITSTGPTTTAEVKPQLRPAQLKTCRLRAQTITTIMNRVDSRLQSQLAFFTAVSARVETFYARQDKTVGDYGQLAAMVTNAQQQAATGLVALKATSSFNCGANNPKGIITAYQEQLAQEQSSLQALRSAIRSLIGSVAKAEGVALSPASTEGRQ